MTDRLRHAEVARTSIRPLPDREYRTPVIGKRRNARQRWKDCHKRRRPVLSSFRTTTPAMVRWRQLPAVVLRFRAITAMIERSGFGGHDRARIAARSASATNPLTLLPTQDITSYQIRANGKPCAFSSVVSGRGKPISAGCYERKKLKTENMRASEASLCPSDSEDVRSICSINIDLHAKIVRLI